MTDVVYAQLEQLIEEAFAASNLIPLLLKAEIERRGIEVSAEQNAFIQSVFIGIAEGDIEQGLAKANAVLQEAEILQSINEKIVEPIDLAKPLARFLEKAPDLITDLAASMKNHLSGSLLQGWKENAQKALSIERQDFARVREEVETIWGEALTRLEMLISLIATVGSQLHEEDVMTKNKVYNVVVRLHARGCQVACEILTLLRQGYADGAHARWRTLHEIAVTAYLISQGDEELAERYRLHTIIETYRGMMIYQEHHVDLGWKPFTDKQVQAVEKRRARLLAKYGDEFKEEYGWASKHLGIKKPNFIDLEKATGFKFLRPFNKMASTNIHAGPKGIAVRLGVPDGDYLLSGPSSNGLLDPGQNTAYTMNCLNSALLPLHLTLEASIYMDAIGRLFVEVFDEFEKADNFSYRIRHAIKRAEKQGKTTIRVKR